MNYQGVDWEKQWALHGLNYRDGAVPVSMEQYGGRPGQMVQVRPGPGFGDMSHPTTRLVLNLMSSFVCNRHIVDVGTGSGVLALCAIALGAKHVHAVDIDESALAHARCNAEFNGVSKHIDFNLPEKNTLPAGVKKDELIVVMNMIRSEQAVALQSLNPIHLKAAHYFTSGVLATERQIYLEQCFQWGWCLQREISEGDWLGFHWSPADSFSR